MEFLVTNNIGGFASQDMRYGNNRKYHGLLVASNKKLERFMILNRVLDEVIIKDEDSKRVIPLYTNIYKNNVVDPAGYQYLDHQEINTSPSWRFKFAENIVSKRVQMQQGQNGVVVSYTLKLIQPATFRLRPLVTYRSFHAVGSDLDWNSGLESAPLENNQVLFRYPERLGSMLVTTEVLKDEAVVNSQFKYVDERDTYFDFYYPIESERGYDSLENLFHPGYFEVELDSGEYDINFHFDYFFSEEEEALQNYISVAAEKEPFVEAEARLQEDTAYFAQTHNHVPNHLLKILLRQAPQFTVDVAENPSVIAGYHWFGDWGRDTFISFNGLYLIRGKFEEAKKLLLRWGELFKDGFLPNRPFEDDYHSIDAVFWYWVATWQYYQATKDVDAIATLLPNLDAVFESFNQGKNNVEVLDTGFLLDKNVGTSLTWMDAKIGDYVVTDRSGLAVEIQMLWYNLLKIGLEFKQLVDADQYQEEFSILIDRLEHNFLDYYWDENAGCLYDLLKPNDTEFTPSTGIRPNQVIGMALPFKLMERDLSQIILRVVERELLTDVGLRTLDQDHPDYKDVYGGPQVERDHAYHQGTIWPFLLGHYLLSYLAAHDFDKNSQAYTRRKLDSFYRSLTASEIAYIPEVYSPKDLTPEGCISQAWSVATMLEVIALLD